MLQQRKRKCLHNFFYQISTKYTEYRPVTRMVTITYFFIHKGHCFLSDAIFFCTLHHISYIFNTTSTMEPFINKDIPHSCCHTLHKFRKADKRSTDDCLCEFPPIFHLPNTIIFLKSKVIEDSMCFHKFNGVRYQCLVR